MKILSKLCFVVLFILSFCLAEASSEHEQLTYNQAVRRVRNWHKRGKITREVSRKACEELKNLKDGKQPELENNCHKCFQLTPLFLKMGSVAYLAAQQFSYHLSKSNIISCFLKQKCDVHTVRALSEELSLHRENIATEAFYIATLSLLLPNRFENAQPQVQKKTTVNKKYLVGRNLNGDVKVLLADQFKKGK